MANIIILRAQNYDEILTRFKHIT